MSKQGIHFKVIARAQCDCGQPVAKGSRKFCSIQCRERSYKGKYQAKRTIWQRARYDAMASKPSPDKVKCLICSKYYVQVGSHVYLRHGMTARAYREEYELPVKRGIVPIWYRKIKGEQAKDNGTVNNLLTKKSKSYRYKKRDPRAIKNTFFKSRAAEAQKLSQEIYPH